MSERSKTLTLYGTLLVMLACVTTAFLIARASSESSSPGVEGKPQTRNAPRHRNLSLQPEALRVSRQLGKRFKPSSRAVSTTAATLTIGGNQQQVTMVRRQTETGETVDLLLSGRGLKWSDREGLRAVSGLPTDTERLLVERLVVDTPDQFVLAQLRGAGYFTIARNVRPNEASEDYNGPLWDLVRVDEPAQTSNRLLSSWRIYYINNQSGLPDRVEYQLNGQKISANFTEWTEQNGEKTPSRVSWSSEGQLLMEYRTTTVSHNQ